MAITDAELLAETIEQLKEFQKEIENKIDSFDLPFSDQEEKEIGQLKSGAFDLRICRVKLENCTLARISAELLRLEPDIRAGIQNLHYQIDKVQTTVSIIQAIDHLLGLFIQRSEGISSSCSRSWGVT